MGGRSLSDQHSGLCPRAPGEGLFEGAEFEVVEGGAEGGEVGFFGEGGEGGEEAEEMGAEGGGRRGGWMRSREGRGR